MANPSNLYAEKIFAEQPSALFTLDDDADYLSLISNRDLTNVTWTKSGVTSVTEVGINATPARPVDDFTVYRVLLPEPSSTVSNPDATATLSLANIDIPSGGFSAGLYLYFTNPYFKTITIKATSTNTYSDSVTLTYADMGEWLFISKTLVTPALTGATLSIEIGYDKNTTATDVYEVYIAGVTAGQYADEFNASSGGVTSSTMPVAPDDVAFGNTYAWTGTANASTSTKTNGNGTVTTNLVTNPNFETNTTSWTATNGAIARVTTQQYVGSYSGQFTVGASGTAGGINIQTASSSVSATNTYTLSFYARDNNTAKSYVAKIGFYNASNALIGSAYVGTATAISSTGWTRVSVTATAPAASNYAKLYLESSTSFVAGDSGKIVYFDAVLFEKTSTASQYFDGNTTDDTYVATEQYGIETEVGYIMVNQNVLSARNTSMPMVFGSSSSTVLIQNLSGEASMVIPGHGFLNEIGQYNSTTMELWLRVTPKNTTPKRILGPLSTTDGLYIDNAHLIFKIGNNIITHYVGEWGRPMLVHLAVSPQNMYMMLNGEVVASKVIDVSSITFADSTVNSKDNDFIGFYTHSDIPTVELDCIAFYPSNVNQILALRRYGYGQAVEFPTKTVKAYAGQAAVFDYPFAKYSNNHNYGSGAKNEWKQGIVENLDVSSNILSTPKYELPKFIFSSGTFDDFLDDNQTQTETVNYFSMLPSGWTNAGYILFEDMHPLLEQTKLVYGVFKVASADNSAGVVKTLIKLKNELTEDYLEITYENGSVYYKTNFAGTATTLKTVSSIGTGDVFAVGLDLDIISSYYPSVREFLGNSYSIKMYFAGNEDLDAAETFAGNIYAIGIGTEKNLVQAKAATTSLFGSEGMLNDTDANYNILQTFKASYTLITRTLIGRTYFDIATNSRWQDYVPLKSLATYEGSTTYDVDFIQFNVNYPKAMLLSGTDIDTTGQNVKTYLSFQALSNGTITDADSLTTISMPANGVQVPATGWATKKYEVIDGAVIYLPTDGGFTVEDYALCMHVTTECDGTINTPISLRSLQIASKTLNATDTVANPVGTRFGLDVIPYTHTGSAYDYDARNEFKIYKGSAPHLYLSNQSGIAMVGTYSSGTNRGIQINLNNNDQISSFQATINFDTNEFPASASTLFDFYDGASSTTFSITAISGDTSRGMITSSSANVEFFLNGKLVVNPIVSVGRWNTIGIRFTQLFNVTTISGYIRIKYPVLLNNLSYYQASDNQVIDVFDPNTWYETLYSGTAPNYGVTWNTIKFENGGATTATSGNGTTATITTTSSHGFVAGNKIYVSGITPNGYNGTYTVTAATSNTVSYANTTTGSQTVAGTITMSWSNYSTFAVSSTPKVVAISPSEIYKSFTGTNKILFEANTDNQLKVGNYQYRSYSNTFNTTKILSAT